MTDPTGLDLVTRVLPVLALLIGALLLARRWAQRGGPRPQSGLRVLARTGLTRSSVLAVVEVGDRRLLVGAGEQGVALLAELDADDLEQARLDTGGQAAHAPPGLSQHGMTAPTERRPLTPDRPWMGLVTRLRTMTTRTHLERPIRARLP